MARAVTGIDPPDRRPPPLPVHVGPVVRDVEAGLHCDHHPRLQGPPLVCPATVVNIHPEIVTDLGCNIMVNKEPPLLFLTHVMGTKLVYSGHQILSVPLYQTDTLQMFSKQSL